MYVLMVIKDALNLLGLNIELEQVTKLEQAEEGNLQDELFKEEKVKQLYSLLNLSIRELCTNYLPLTMEQEVKSDNCKIKLSELKNFIRVLQVKLNNKIVKHKIINHNLVLPIDGNFVVKYVGYPKISSINDTIELDMANTDVVVLGLCAYYCLANGMFDEFNRFNSEYREKAEKVKEMKTFVMPRS